MANRKWLGLSQTSFPTQTRTDTKGRQSFTRDIEGGLTGMFIQRLSQQDQDRIGEPGHKLPSGFPALP